jgi:hypothetical protein
MSIEDRFNKLVVMIQKDMGTLSARLERLEKLVASRQQAMGDAPHPVDVNWGGRPLSPTTVQWGVPASDETIVAHPITGKGVKAKEVDPTLVMRMRFGDDE